MTSPLERRVQRLEQERGGGTVFAFPGEPDYQARVERARRTGAELVIIKTDVLRKEWDR
jgi:hypothetical protein